MYGTVEHVERLTPTMTRITFGGAGLDDFVPTDRTDQYVNAYFVPDAATYGVPFDAAEARRRAVEERPRVRRYTVRRWEAATRLLTMDFVAHGDVGVAGRWARHATLGERLQMIGPGGNYRPDNDADWHLFVGDESALPAIGASLDVLDSSARAVVIAVVDGPDSEIALDSRATLDVQWLHRNASTEPEALLSAAVSAMTWPTGRPDVFVHGEAGEVRSVRKHLIAERGVDARTASMSPYWRRDHTDEAWRRVKRQWLAEQADDV